MADGDTKELKAKLRFDVDKPSGKNAVKAVDQLGEATKRAGEEARQAQARFNAMREQAEKLQQIGMQLSLAGAAIGTPFLLAAKNYVATMGTGEEVSRQWLSSTQQMEQATLRMGRVAAQQLLPVMEKLADVAEQAAEYAERNPEAVNNVLKVAGALLVAGQAINLLAGTKKLFANIGSIGSGVAAGAASGTAGAFAGIAGAGLAYQLTITKLISDQYKKIPFVAKIVQKEAEFLTNAAEELFGPEMAAKVARWTGLVEEAGDALEDTPQNTFTDTQMNAFMSYKDAENGALVDYNKNRAKLISDYESNSLASERAYQANRAKTMRDFYTSEQRLEADYYRQRMQNARTHNIEVQRAEEDHQRSLQRMQADHNLTMDELLDAQDAFGMIREMQSYERQRSEANEDFSVQMRRQSEDYARQVAEQEQSFAIQRQQRMADFQLQLKDAAEQHAEERALARKQHAEALRELKSQYDDERRQRRSALITALQEELGIKRQFNAAWFAELRAMIAAANQQSVAGSRASGGYVSDGIYRMHDHEYVLNKNTTKALERMVGGNLNQQSALAALSARSGQISYTDNRRFDGRISAADREDLRRMTELQLAEVFG